MTKTMPEDFHGAKVALFIGDKLLVIQRDDLRTIPWPNHWDFPGGGREAGETPMQTVLRETMEEVRLHLTEDDLIWARSYGGGAVWFFVAKLPQSHKSQIVLGDEGQRWVLMAPCEYMAHPLRIPHFADRLATYLERASFN